MNPMFLDPSLIERSGGTDMARRRMILDIAGGRGGVGAAGVRV
jgi:hypothetical protein